jgi:hypothetical protein
MACHDANTPCEVRRSPRESKRSPHHWLGYLSRRAARDPAARTAPGRGDEPFAVRRSTRGHRRAREPHRTEPGSAIGLGSIRSDCEQVDLAPVGRVAGVHSRAYDPARRLGGSTGGYGSRPPSTTPGVRTRNLAVAFAAVLLSGACCGEDALAPGTGQRLAVELRITVRPEGSGGFERVRRIECGSLGQEAIDPRCRLLGGLEPRDLVPVPRRAACAQIYGGPGTARVTGELRGTRVSASFDLTNACEIARWRRNSALLGPPPTIK